MRRWLLLVPALVVGGSVCALDLDGDGMSDLWQYVHGVPAGAGAADWDGDGFTNLVECTAATDPWDRGSLPSIRLLNDAAAQELHVIVPTASAISYEIQSGSDLAAWTPLATLSGDGGEQSAVVSVDESRAFFRLNIQPSPDTDGDGLNKWEEEALLGTSDTNTDSDGDLLPDGWEAAHGLNPALDEYAAGRRTQRYTHDAADRLTGVAETLVESFGYDDEANIELAQ